jgi:hypothetical protein
MPKSFVPKSDIAKIDYKKLAEKSPLLWSIAHVPLPKGVGWDFADRTWQIDFFDDPSPSTVVMKPTQIGLTTISLARYLYFAVHNRCRLMYTLPRQDDVTDLVTSRLDGIIQASPLLSSLAGSVNNVRLKSLGSSYLHFMEASVTPRMLDVDYLVHDEVDLSNQGHLEQYASRLDASQFREHHRLSTPTLEGYGIHALFEQSDKKMWFVKCPRCNYEFTLNWELNTRFGGNRTWYACEKCDKEITSDTINSGKWIVTGNPNSDISGYSISQMMTPFISPDRLKAQFDAMTPKNFANLRLGLPYAPSVGGFSKVEVMDKCFSSGHGETIINGATYYLGADQGNELHVAIGMVVGDVMKIVHLEKVSFADGFERIASLMNRYRVAKAVVDALPNRHSAYQLANRFPGRMRLATFSEIDSLYREEDTNRVIINKPDSYDRLRDMVANGRLQFYGGRSSMTEAVSDALDHLSNMRRDEVTRTSKSGGDYQKIVWVNTGPDHYADAIDYLSIACDRAGNSSLSAREVGFRDSFSDNSTEPFNQNPYAKKRRFAR